MPPVFDKLCPVEEVSNLSRAFITELDGWNFCKSRQTECSDAALDGSCERSCCKYGQETPKTGADTAKQPEK